LVNNDALWPALAVVKLPVEEKVPVVGLYISEVTELKPELSPPPVIRTVPLFKIVDV